MLADEIVNSGFTLLNDGNPTFLHSYDSYSHIDLALASPAASFFCTSRTLEDTHRSDYFPLVIDVIYTRPSASSLQTQN